MRQDQYEKLQALSERLTDVFLGEAEPAKWPGHNIEPGAMDQQTRGDRYWCKKDAVATLACVQRISTLVHMIQTRSYDVGGEQAKGDDDVDLSKEISAAEAEAEKLLDEVQRGVRKQAFDKHVHKKG